MPSSPYARWTAGESSRWRSISTRPATAGRRSAPKKDERLTTHDAAGDPGGEEHCFDHARWVGDATAGNIQRRSVVWRRPWKGQTEGDIHRASKCRDLDRRHTD